MGEQELVFDASEFHIIAVTCDACGAGITFDAANHMMHAPSVCPSCSKDLAHVRDWLLGFRSWYKAITTSKEKFTFRVTAPK
jgi:hypothetical protein